MFVTKSTLEARPSAGGTILGGVLIFCMSRVKQMSTLLRNARGCSWTTMMMNPPKAGCWLLSHSLDCTFVGNGVGRELDSCLLSTAVGARRDPMRHRVLSVDYDR
jgi:hypothetical protein